MADNTGNAGSDTTTTGTVPGKKTTVKKKPVPSVEPDPQFPPQPNPSSDMPDSPQAGVEHADTQAGVLQGQAKTPPTLQGDINQILEPYLKELQNLGPEYQQEMNYLAPYLTGTGAGAPQSFAQIEAGSKADESSTGSQAVNAADQAAGSTLLNQQPPGFGNLASDASRYESTIPYQQPVQAGIAYQKYLQTYGGLKPDTQGWSPQAKAAYEALTGSSGQSGKNSLGSPTVVGKDNAASQAANKLLTTSGVGAGQGNSS